MEKENYAIRIASVEDAEKILDIYSYYVKNTAITFEYTVPSVNDFKRRMETTLKNYPYLVAEKGGDILGYAYASKFHERAAYQWSAETSIYVKADKKRLGTGRRLYSALEEILKLQNVLNLNACIAYTEKEDIFLANDSEKFHLNAGYHLAGRFFKCGYKFDRWYDMIWMEKHIGLHKKHPPKFIPFSELDKTLNL